LPLLHGTMLKKILLRIMGNTLLLLGIGALMLLNTVIWDG
jgi:hypothetical protein